MTISCLSSHWVFATSSLTPDDRAEKSDSKKNMVPDFCPRNQGDSLETKRASSDEKIREQKIPSVNLVIMDERWENKVPDMDHIHEMLETSLRTLKTSLSPVTVSIVFTNDHEITALNHTYRHQQKPTNVLSFPSSQEEELGDIILALETIQKESLDAQIPFSHHLTHLIVHGFLHLLGYDHETDNEAQVMESLEINILHHLHIKNPYEEQ